MNVVILRVYIDKPSRMIAKDAIRCRSIGGSKYEKSNFSHKNWDDSSLC